MNRRLTELDGTTLLADEGMVITSEGGVARAAQFVPEAGENRIKLIQGVENPIGFAHRQQGVTKLEPKIHRLSEIVRTFRQFLQDYQCALEKLRSIGVCVKQVRLGACPLQVLERFIPDSTFFCMISEPLNMLIKASSCKHFECAGCARMQDHSSFPQ